VVAEEVEDRVGDGVFNKPDRRSSLTIWTIAVDKGFLAIEELINAKKIQLIADVRRSKYRLIGEILMDIGA